MRGSFVRKWEIILAASFISILFIVPLAIMAKEPGKMVKTPRSARSASEAASVAAESRVTLEELQKLLVEQMRLVESLQQQLNQQQKEIEALKAETAGRAKTDPAATDLLANQSTPVIASTPSAELTGAMAQPTSRRPVIAPESKPAQPEPKASAVAVWDKGKDRLGLRSEEGNLEAYLIGYGQFDYRGYQSGPSNSFLIRRARLGVEGKLLRYFDYRLQGDLADTRSTLLRDFYLNFRPRDDFQLRFGQFKEPFSQEELLSGSVMEFVERSMVNNLAPSRSPGLMAHGNLGKGVLQYQAGTFNGKGLLANNNNDTPESVVRLRFNPWKQSQAAWLKGLAVGGAYAQGRTAGGTSVRGQTESRSVTFYSPTPVNGKVTRANGELTWVQGPAALRAEYNQTNEARDNLGPQGRALPGVVGKGYMAQFSYLLTGETKPESERVQPNHDFLAAGGGPHWGAWELKVRYADLQISDGTAKSNRANSLYFGANWYLNRYVRYMVDVGYEQFKDPLRTPRPGDRNNFVVLSRIQVAF